MSALKDRLREARKEAKRTQTEVAEAVGMKQSSYSELETGKSGGSTYLPAIANYLKVSALWLQTGEGPKHSSSVNTKVKRINEGFEDAGPINAEKRWVPVKAYSKMGPDGFFTDMGYPGNGGDGYVPTSSAGPNAYAVKGTGGSMHPAIRDGWYCVCDPDAPAVSGEYVQVCLKDGRCTIKEFISLQNNLLTLLAVNSGERWTFELSEVECIAGVTDIVPPSRHRQEYPGMPVFEVEHHF